MTEVHEKSDVAENRGNVYGLLATVFSQEISSDFLLQIKDPRFLGVLSGLGVEFNGIFFEKPDDDLLEDLAVEFTRLFLGPGKHISPHESIHHERNDGQWGTLWGQSTVDVKKFIESAGLGYKSEYKGLPDHISVELEFMQQVARAEAQAWEDEDTDKALYCLKIEKKFIEEHLACWIPVFCEKVIQQAELPFYRELAGLTRKFIEFEREELGKEALQG
ncbi:MAG: molecular chaperone TorD family protein [Proteobacteria bacterium]|nr:molecular chaperone TorD family protein [Pseudomonadota bacterium]MBU1696310.1 molecular chaperone TorD family protein [Pseudomonadota bacterium]